MRFYEFIDIRDDSFVITVVRHSANVYASVHRVFDENVDLGFEKVAQEVQFQSIFVQILENDIVYKKGQKSVLRWFFLQNFCDSDTFCRSSGL